MRFKRWAAGLWLFLLTLPLGAAHAEGKTLYWKRWDSHITVESNGDMRIVETHEVAFTSGQFRFGLLGIDMSRLEAVTDVSVAEGGTAYEQTWYSWEERPGTFYTDTSSDDKNFEITYFFLNPPVERETRTITIAYTVKGATRYYDGGDQVYWEAVGALGWPVHRATVLLTLPTGAAPREGIDPVVCYGLPCRVDVNGNRIRFTLTQRSDGNTPLEVRAQFPHGVLTGSAPGWQVAYDRQRYFDEVTRPQMNLLLGALGLALLIGGPVGVLVLWRVRGRDPEIGPVPEYLAEPPSDLPPAVVGTLLDERADLQDVMSTLTDLARRGYLTMEEEDNLYRRVTFVRASKPIDELRNYERLMLDGIFWGNRTQRSLKDLSGNFYTVIPQMQDSLYAEVVREGLFTGRPDEVRSRWLGWGIGALVVAVVSIFAVPLFLGGVVEAVALVAAGLGLTGVALMLASRVMPAKTRKGAEQAALWSAFRTYLQRIKQYNADLSTATDQFDRYLPYAVAFGLDKTWTQTFAQVPSTPMPAWYVPYAYRRAAQGGGLQNVTGTVGGVGSGSSSSSPGIGSAPDLMGQIARPAESIQSVSDKLAVNLQSMSNSLASALNSAADTLTSRPLPPPSSGSWGVSGFWDSASSGGSGWSSGSRSRSSWSSGSSGGRRSSWSGGGSRRGGSGGRRSGGFG